MALQLLILAVLLLVVPLLAGDIFIDMDGSAGRLPLRWVSGQFCLWAGFQLICVPFVLVGGSFTHMTYLYLAYCLVSAVLGVARDGVRWKKKKAAGAIAAMPRTIAAMPRIGRRPGRMEAFLWFLFAAVLLFQLVQAVRMTYTDGDDAFYVAVSTTVVNDELMYRKLPYTGYTTELEARYGLAPFPVWIAYLAKLSGMEAVSVAHLVLPAVLIAFAYTVFYLLGRQLLPARGGRLPLYLLFTGLLVLFGNYSIYTAENFLIARSRQGKAALCSIVIPFLFYLLLLWLKRLDKQEKLSAVFYLLLLSVNLTGCLCSTLGGVIICMLTGITGLLGAVSCRRWGQLIPMALCCLPCVGYAVLYLFQG